MPLHDKHLIHPKYRAYIDGLRAVAVLSVVGFHAFPSWVPGGYIGVDIFFVISGFFIASGIYADLERNNFSCIEFYSRRIRRIFPALIVVLASTYALGWFVLVPEEYKELGKHIAGGAAFIDNFIFRTEFGYFDQKAELKPLLHLWPLGIEGQFYLFFPLLLVVGWKRNISLLTILSVAILMSFGLNAFMVLDHRSQFTDFYLTFTRLWEIFLGAALAHITIASRSKQVIDSAWGHFAPSFMELFSANSAHQLWSLIGLILIILSVVGFNNNIFYPGFWAVLPVSGAFLLIASDERALVNRYVLANPLMVSLGQISYPLYLWHWMLLSYARIYEGKEPANQIKASLVMASIVLALFTYRFIEKPIRYNNNKKEVSAIVLLVLMIVLGTIGYWTFKNDGLASRESFNEYFLFANSSKESRNAWISNGGCDQLLPHSLSHKYFHLGITCNSNSLKPEVLFLGDSHAIALYEAIYHKRIDLNAMVVGVGRCLPFRDYLSHSDADRSKYCHSFIGDIDQIVDETRSVKTVVLVSRGEMYVDGSSLGFEDKNNLDIHEPFKKQLLFVDEYSKLISKLLHVGKKVIFFMEVPTLDSNPKDCVYVRRIPILENKTKDCVIKKEVALEHQRLYRELILKMGRANPNVKFYDPFRTFCDEQLCYGGAGKTMYYFDQDHLGIEGSEKVLKDLIRAYPTYFNFSHASYS